MSRHAALLRGINVGRAKRVAMADLRALIEDLGYTEVKTLLNSGNVAFTATGSARDAGARIEAALATRLGVTSRVTVLSGAELETALARNPFGKTAGNPSLLLVAVPATAADLKRFGPLLKEDWAPEALAVGRRVGYVWCPNGTIKGRLWPAVEKTLGDAVTSRTWATMTKLHALVQG